MAVAPVSVLDSKITRKPGRISLAIFVSVLLGGVVYAGGSLLSDLSQLRSTPGFEFVLLGRNAGYRAWIRVCQRVP